MIVIWGNTRGKYYTYFNLLLVIYYVTVCPLITFDLKVFWRVRKRVHCFRKDNRLPIRQLISHYRRQTVWAINTCFCLPRIFSPWSNSTRSDPCRKVDLPRSAQWRWWFTTKYYGTFRQFRCSSLFFAERQRGNRFIWMWLLWSQSKSAVPSWILDGHQQVNSYDRAHFATLDHLVWRLIYGNPSLCLGPPDLLFGVYGCGGGGVVLLKIVRNEACLCQIQQRCAVLWYIEFFISLFLGVWGVGFYLNTCVWRISGMPCIVLHSTILDEF